MKHHVWPSREKVSEYNSSESNVEKLVMVHVNFPNTSIFEFGFTISVTSKLQLYVTLTKETIFDFHLGREKIKILDG